MSLTLILPYFWDLEVVFTHQEGVKTFSGGPMEPASGYSILIEYHEGKSAEVSRDKLALTSGTTWAAVETRVSEICKLARATFTVESENGLVLGTAGPPLEWVREDQQRRPWSGDL
jgi:hypothetical protein